VRSDRTPIHARSPEQGGGTPASDDTDTDDDVDDDDDDDDDDDEADANAAAAAFVAASNSASFISPTPFVYVDKGDDNVK
jgi:hypothetical protein